MRRLHCTRHLHRQPQRLAQRQRTVAADPRIEGILRVKGHYYVRQVTVGGADLQNINDVRVAGQPAHRPLFPEKPRPVLLVKFGGEHLHHHRAFQVRLGATVDHRSRSAWVQR
ncbi:hypothetical protein WSS_A20519 [Rhodococcus opacus M213]|uniref:Uncharacterized protein n=1 Tax=Rhodococcus opacus M213 TaxID=1129896 RepID=K8XGT0_RHOOP|nr:hypothetical protein WSS_A20519 [Rhodococcus opacus M213]